MTEPMSEERLAQIRAEHAAYLQDVQRFGLGGLARGAERRRQTIGELLAEAGRARAAESEQRQRADQLDETLGWQYVARNTGERVRSELAAENDRLRAQLAEIGGLGRIEYEIGIQQPGEDDAQQYCGFSEADVKARAAEQGATFVERVCRRGKWKAADDGQR